MGFPDSALKGDAETADVLDMARHRAAALLMVITALGGCQWSGSAQTSPPENEAVLRALHGRILLLQARLRRPAPMQRQPTAAAPLASTRRPLEPPRQAVLDSARSPATGAAPGRITEAAAKAPLATTLLIARSEIPKLQSGAAWLASLPSRQASQTVLDNWRTTEDQARTIKFFFHMNRTSAAAILAEMPIRLLVFGASREHMKVYAPGHHAADQAGYVLVRITETN